MAKALMVQGTASSAGKSTLVTALCRILRQDGIRVAPFKAQNMSLNAYVTPDGREIGRAQAVQAEAAGLEPSVEMNPILLKPEGQGRCQVVLMGRVCEEAPPIGTPDYVRRLWPTVEQALSRLLSEYEVVVMEGAGSPAEVNLREGDLVNMRVARFVSAPVLIVGDIDRGGLLAHFVGTLQLLEERDRELVKGLVVNRFRGDIGFLAPGLSFLEEYTGKRVLGVIPYVGDLRVAAEDSVELEGKRSLPQAGLLDIAVVRLPHISNFDDFDALEAEPLVSLRYVKEPGEFGRPDLVILPGTKATCPDLLALHESGLAPAIMEHVQSRGALIGVCGGYQMLGHRVLDPEGVESSLAEVEGLDLLPVQTVLRGAKVTQRVTGTVATPRGLLGSVGEAPLMGYEIHIGDTEALAPVSPALRLRRSSGEEVADGCIDEQGAVFGTYVHGLFDNRGIRSSIIEFLLSRRGTAGRAAKAVHFDRQAEYDRLADVVRSSVDLPAIYDLIGR
jgi:adenosylcobyric acid synthase